jgi:hypothetical protein
MADGAASVRCAYLTNNAALIGFTLTNGGTWLFASDNHDKDGAGIWCETNAAVSNCVIVGNVSFSFCGGAYQGTYTDCLIASNSCRIYGGGAYKCTLRRCTLTANAALATSASGGGAYKSTLTDCTLLSNSASYYGGGADSSSLTSCTLAWNSASSPSGYAGGGVNNSVLNNCTLISNAAHGYGGGACSSSLTNCELRGNSSFSGGGGANLCTLRNCRLTSNSTSNLGAGTRDSTLYNCWLGANSGYIGGGAAVSTLYNCAIVSNSVSSSGGGAYSCYLTNCTVVGNSAEGYAGGVNSATVANSIVFHNTAPSSTNHANLSFSYCCTDPLPSSGDGNFTNDPIFLDPANGNFRLQTNSPCIDTGNSAYVTTATDLDGRPRLVGGGVDLGAYEAQTSTSGWFIGWLQQYALPTDGSADHTDADNDGRNNWQEWICGTDPTNALSVLTILSATNTVSGTAVNWRSVTNRTYFLECSTNLRTQPAFFPIQSNIVGQAGTTSFTDTNATGAGPSLYRIGVQ